VNNREHIRAMRRLLSAGDQDAYEARLEVRRARRYARRDEARIATMRAEELRIRALVDEGELEDLDDGDFEE